MSEQNNTDRTISILCDSAELKLKIRAEGAVRGHNISEAAEMCLKLGLPLYLEKVQAKITLAGQAKKRRQVA